MLRQALLQDVKLRVAVVDGRIARAGRNVSVERKVHVGERIRADGLLSFLDFEKHVVNFCTGTKYKKKKLKCVFGIRVPLHSSAFVL